MKNGYSKLLKEARRGYLAEIPLRVIVTQCFLKDEVNGSEVLTGMLHYLNPHPAYTGSGKANAVLLFQDAFKDDFPILRDISHKDLWHEINKQLGTEGMGLIYFGRLTAKGLAEIGLESQISR